MELSSVLTLVAAGITPIVLFYAIALIPRRALRLTLLVLGALGPVIWWFVDGLMQGCYLIGGKNLECVGFGFGTIFLVPIMSCWASLAVAGYSIGRGSTKIPAS